MEDRIKDSGIFERLLKFQRNEITEHFIYYKLSKAVGATSNSEILAKIAEDEYRHYNIWKQLTKRDVKPAKVKIWWFYFISRIFGFTFGIKLMERGEELAQENYHALAGRIEMIGELVREENEHEHELIKLLDEERLQYMGSVVLGLNDALVELTGALAGFTFALQNTRLIALTGLITGIAAAFSMAASEYLSTKSEDTAKQPLKASVYTGSAYIVTVLVLIIPYLLFHSVLLCLGLTLSVGILIIGIFNYYFAVAKDLKFKARFFEMTAISLGIAALSFCVGLLLRSLIGVDI